MYSKETAGNSLKREQSDDQEDSAGDEFRDADATGDNFLYVHEYRCMYTYEYTYRYMHIYM
jgi:hypothetical protein